MMALFRDLDDFKLDTIFERDPERVVHGRRATKRIRKRQPDPLVEIWATQKLDLGAGTFGVVRLETLASPLKTKYRAVKDCTNRNWKGSGFILGKNSLP